MKKTKVWISVALCACTLAFAAACSKGPDDVAIKVMKALRDGDGDAVKDNCTAKEAKNLKTGRKQMQKVWASASFEVVETDTFGDESTVAVEIGLEGGATETATVELAQDDGDWKVSKGAWPPGTVLGIVLEACWDKDFAAIDANCTAKGAKWHKEMAQHMQQVTQRPPHYAWKVLETSIHGNEAEVTIEESGVGESGNETSKGTFNLKKVNGAWKVEAYGGDDDDTDAFADEW